MQHFIQTLTSLCLLIILSILPSFVLAFIIYKYDVIEKEPLKLLRKLFLVGVLSTIISLALELWFDKLFFTKSEPLNYFQLFMKSFFGISIIEEGTKWLFTYFLTWKNKNFNYEYDAIVYSVFIALGFATLENLVAVLSKDFSGGIIIALLRSVMAVPGHAFFGILMGYYLGKAKRYRVRRWVHKSKKYLWSSIAFPILAHGLFDYFLFIENKLGVFLAILLIAYLYVTSYIKVKKVSGQSKPI